MYPGYLFLQCCKTCIPCSILCCSGGQATYYDAAIFVFYRDGSSRFETQRIEPVAAQFYFGYIARLFGPETCFVMYLQLT